MDNPFVDCWEGVYLRHRYGLFSLVLSIVGQRQTAEDVVHETFVSVCRCHEIPLDPDAYVYRAVRNTSIDFLRKANRDCRLKESLFESISVSGDNGVLAGGPEEELIQKERQAQVRNAIDSLQSDSKQVVLLKQYAGLTFQQIADVLEIPMKTAATRYRRVLMKLKEELEDRL